jgi:hypothetical protein
MNLHWPQYVWIAMTAFTLLVAAVMDGKPKTGNHSLALYMLSVAFGAWLLWCGGFFG